jgi:hypothetical protein
MPISNALRTIYYNIKPILPRKFQIWLRRKMTQREAYKYSKTWPILESAGTQPEQWWGWPHQKRFALVLTHDVDTAVGQKKTRNLADLENRLGFRSSFNFVPERYYVSPEIRMDLQNNGFEVGVHGLYHDGKLYKSKSIFDDRAAIINMYLKKWNAAGFRSPAMHHNLDWIHELKIEYDASTFDTDPFEPQSDGVRTVFPFWVYGADDQNGYVEMPYTLPQDFTTFILMQEKDINIWKRKLDWIASKGGMALLNTHPDYMNFSGVKLGIEEYPVIHYERFLEYVKSEYPEQYWHALPVDVARFVKSNTV